MGAWIETALKTPLWASYRPVAPYMGAWIETLLRLYRHFPIATSLPTWGRGLKRFHSQALELTFLSLPTWGRGLKLCARASSIA